MFEFLFELIAEVLLETFIYGIIEYAADSIAGLFSLTSFTAVKPDKKLTFSDPFTKKHYSKRNQENHK